MRMTKTTKDTDVSKKENTLPKTTKTPNTTSQTPIEIALQIDENGMTTLRNLYEFYN